MIRPSVPGVLAFATVLVVISACGSAPSTMSATPVRPTPSPSAALSPAPLAVVTAGPSPSATPSAWSRVALGQGARAAGLTTLGGTFVAVGGLDGLAAAWTSSNGAAWQPSTVSGTGIAINKAVPLRSGLVGFGCATGPGCLDRKAPSGAWTSPDGRIWTVHALPRDLPYTYLDDLAASSGEAVIVGSATDCPPEVGGIVLAAARLVACAVHAEAWWSTDGAAWHLVRASGCGGVLGSVAVAASGTFVALGDLAHACVSADGRRWRAASGTVPGGIGVGGLVGTGSGLLAAATDGLWISDDGSAWSRVTDQALAGSQPGGLASTGGRIVAFGQHDGAAAVWVSTDGRRWTAVPGDPTFGGQGFGSAAFDGGRLVVAGGPTSFSGHDPGGSIWVMRLAAR